MRSSVRRLRRLGAGWLCCHEADEPPDSRGAAVLPYGELASLSDPCRGFGASEQEAVLASLRGHVEAPPPPASLAAPASDSSEALSTPAPGLQDSRVRRRHHQESTFLFPHCTLLSHGMAGSVRYFTNVAPSLVVDLASGLAGAGGASRCCLGTAWRFLGAASHAGWTRFQRMMTSSGAVDSALRPLLEPPSSLVPPIAAHSAAPRSPRASSRGPDEPSGDRRAGSPAPCSAPPASWFNAPASSAVAPNAAASTGSGQQLKAALLLATPDSTPEPWRGDATAPSAGGQIALQTDRQTDR
jgi:hypothetical protein